MVMAMVDARIMAMSMAMVMVMAIIIRMATVTAKKLSKINRACGGLSAGNMDGKEW